MSVGRSLMEAGLAILKLEVATIPEGETLEAASARLGVSFSKLLSLRAELGLPPRKRGSKTGSVRTAALRVNVMRRLAEGASFAEVGRSLGLSRQRIHQISRGE